MKRLLLFLCTGFLFFSASNAIALTIEIINDPSTVSNLILIEDFESYGAASSNTGSGWYSSLATSVGVFQATGNAGTGDTAYQGSDGGAKFSIQDKTDSWYGRENQTSGGSQWLDSGDITELTLNISIAAAYTDLYFWMQDPSDCGATTTVDGVSYSQSLTFLPGQTNGESFLVHIGLEADETLQALVFSVSSTGDGYGLDDFSIATAPVPEPATMLLLGTGFLGLAGFKRRKQ